jgi:hypothetical protein
MVGRKGHRGAETQREQINDGVFHRIEIYSIAVRRRAARGYRPAWKSTLSTFRKLASPDAGFERRKWFARG